MATIDVNTNEVGAVLDGTAHETIMRFTLGRIGAYIDRALIWARSISPVLTGTFRSSFAYQTRRTPTGAEGLIWNTDTPGKVRVIEYGFPPARADLRGRAPRHVFAGTVDHMEQVLIADGARLTVELVREVSR